MSDFDFDELDRAVSGVLGGEEPTATRPTEPAALTNEEKPTEKPTPTPAMRRSSGRFMDVVHPSSDMRGRGVSPTPVAKSPVMAPAASPEPDDEPTAEIEPAGSPFLPDAKVEKRPLGGPAPMPETGFIEDSLAPAPEEELLEAPDEPRIEAHTMPDPIDFAEQSAPTAPEEAVSEPSKEEEEHHGAEELAEAQPVGPVAITPQYTERASTADAPGAIYDTEAYHKPLTPAAKKHSGVWVAVWILLLVILGAGAGAAAYLFFLQ